MPKPYVVGDMPKFEATCVDEDTGSAIDLTGATVTLRWSLDGGGSNSASMTISDATNGVAWARFGASDLSEEGRLVLAVRIVDSSGNQFTSQEFNREVRRAI